MMAERAALYARVSTARQEQDQTVASQVAALHKAARASALWMVEGDRTRDDERASVVMGFDVHAGAVIDGRDRRRVERLCRYLARPPIAQKRLVEITSEARRELGFGSGAPMSGARRRAPRRCTRISRIA
jgi:hypothetical protein